MTRTLVLHPDLGSDRRGRQNDDALAEAEALTQAIDLDLVESRVVPLARAVPGTLFGKGKTEEIGELCERQSIDLVVVDGALSPVQQRNLERRWKVKILDRTGLILEIFGARAQTREGVLQVELAHLVYQRSRLVRSWTHLERQRGSLGFIGGPGETQIESDRRLLAERIGRIRRELRKVVKTRALHRAARRKVPHPIVALVGYTNAGKSTLFNRLSNASVHAEDMLFATLDPTMRKIDLPSGRTAILSDTVGFISDLPTELVAAFRATLEEVLEADLIVHVRDISHGQTEQQRDEVHLVLESLGVDVNGSARIISALNKTDLVPPEELPSHLRGVAQGSDSTAISALTGEGCAALLALIDEKLFPRRLVTEIDLGHAEGAAIAWLYRHSEVLRREDRDSGVSLRVEMTEREFYQFEKSYGDRATIAGRQQLVAQ